MCSLLGGIWSSRSICLLSPILTWVKHSSCFSVNLKSIKYPKRKICVHVAFQKIISRDHWTLFFFPANISVWLKLIQKKFSLSLTPHILVIRTIVIEPFRLISKTSITIKLNCFLWDTENLTSNRFLGSIPYVSGCQAIFETLPPYTLEIAKTTQN